MQKYVIALYIRLSLEDCKYDSLSIENQRLVLHEYAAGMPEADHAEIWEFVDNGYTGTNFERPQVQNLLEMVRANKIDCIIVKDFSRFGRNSIETGYSRRNEVRGTKGFYQEDGAMMYVEGRTPHVEGDWTHRAEPAKPYLTEYQHDLWKEYREFGLRGGHGGMDYLVLRAFVESVQRREAPPIDTYDTAAWMAVTALSEESIAKGGAPVAFPDFTSGRWLQARDEKPSGIYALDP